MKAQPIKDCSMCNCLIEMYSTVDDKIYYDCVHADIQDEVPKRVDEFPEFPDWCPLKDYEKLSSAEFKGCDSCKHSQHEPDHLICGNYKSWLYNYVVNETLLCIHYKSKEKYEKHRRKIS